MINQDKEDIKRRPIRSYILRQGRITKAQTNAIHESFQKYAVIFENKNAIQSQSYGAAARGGSTRSDIIIDDSEIFFPKKIEAM